MHEKYLRDLCEEEKAALDRCLRTFNLDRLLGSLFEFIETHVKYSPDGELKWQ